MNTAVLAIQFLLTYGPSAYSALVELLHNTNPTKDDFLALGHAVSQESYDSFIAERRAERGLPAVSPLP